MKLLMNIAMATAVLLSTTSCGAPTYGIEAAQSITYEGQKEYSYRILEKYSEYLGPEVVGVSPKIKWVLYDQCPDRPKIQLKWNGGCYNGIAFTSKHSCNIFLAHRIFLRDSSLAHELLHCSLNKVDYEYGDPKHTHPMWKEVNNWR